MNNPISAGRYEFHRSIDNFYIGEGGADLYIWVQVHFISDPHSRVDFERYLTVSLSGLTEEGDREILVQNNYTANNSERKYETELLET
ncbi:MAG: hypothetical protein ACOC36_07890, partial [Fibrobacterota bacterium]